MADYQEYPKWCHDIKDGKIISSTLVQNKAEEDALSFGKKQPKGKSPEWDKKD